MRLVLVGPPGSGKGTQADKLVERLGVTYVGTGDILRAAIRDGTPMGKRVEPLMKQGLLVPDPEVNDVVAELFRGPNRPDCFVMDGYPRTYSQAIAFEALLRQQMLNLDAVINLTIPDDEVVKRISGRRCCANPACGLCFNIHYKPSRAAGKCDKCGSELVLRDDDKEETVRRRLGEFHKNTEALVNYYRKQGVVKDIPATDPPDVTFRNIQRALGRDESTEDPPAGEGRKR